MKMLHYAYNSLIDQILLQQMNFKTIIVQLAQGYKTNEEVD